MSGKLYDLFAFYAIKYNQLDIIEVYNRFLCVIGIEEQNEVSAHFSLFIKTGEAARSAPDSIKKILMKEGEKGV